MCPYREIGSGERFSTVATGEWKEAAARGFRQTFSSSSGSFGWHRNLCVTEEAEIGGAGGIVHEELPAGGCMGGMTADTGKFPLGIGWIGFSAHRVVVARTKA